MYRVELTRQAAKELERLTGVNRKRAAARIDGLALEPRPASARKLAGDESFYRIRVGDFRVIYSVANDVVLVTVIRVGHCRDVIG